MNKPTVVITPEQMEKYCRRAHKAFWDVVIEMAMDITVGYETMDDDTRDYVEDELGQSAAQVSTEEPRTGSGVRACRLVLPLRRRPTDDENY